MQIGKVNKTKIQISHIHTVPKSTSESQAQITHLLTAPEPARGAVHERCSLIGQLSLFITERPCLLTVSLRNTL